MNWLIFALLSAFLATIVNYIDKYLIEKYIKRMETGSILIFAAATTVPIMLLLKFLKPNVASISGTNAFLIVISGAMYALSLVCYLRALKEDETSSVVPLIQFIPVISLILGSIFLKEFVSFNQILGMLLIFCGAMWLNLELLPGKKVKIKYKVVGLMLLTSFLAALNLLLFKIVALNASFFTTVFWEYIGFIGMALVLLIGIKSYRDTVVHVLKSNKIKVLSLNFINETINLTSKMLFNYAALLVPIGIVSFAVEGLQPVMTLMVGIGLTVFLPNVVKENIEKKYLAKKLAGILIIIVGTTIMSL